jgi:hypothetical protein
VRRGLEMLGLEKKGKEEDMLEKRRNLFSKIKKGILEG